MSMWRRHTTGILAVGIAAILIALAAAFIVTNFSPKTEVRLGTGVFQVDLALTQEEWYQGLSGVTELKPNGGLLFDFKTSDRHGIVMRDMEIPLDIIWLDQDQKVLHIVKNASPDLGESRVFQPNSPARYVLEVNAGVTTKFNITVGSYAQFTITEQSS